MNTPKTAALWELLREMGWSEDQRPVSFIMQSHAELEEELAEVGKDYRCLAELLDGHDATECRANLVRLKESLAAITCEEGELWELRQENARLKDNLANLSKLHANEAEEWGKRENWRMSSVCRELDQKLAAETARADEQFALAMELAAKLETERALADRLAKACESARLYANGEALPTLFRLGRIVQCALAAYKASRNQTKP